MSDKYFLAQCERGFGTCLVLKQEVPGSELVKILNRTGARVLRLSISAGWFGEDIGFLENLKNCGLRGVEVYSMDVKDLLPLLFLPDLELIGLETGSRKIPDFSKFSQLSYFFARWEKSMKSLFSCDSLNDLNIVNFPSESLDEICGLNNLVSLALSSRKLTTLSGIEKLHKLEKLDLYSCSNLCDLKNLSDCSNMLEIEFDRCKKIDELSFLEPLNLLRDLLLLDCGNIESLQPLETNARLQRVLFYGDTNILDGDLTPIFQNKNIRKVAFADRKHYSHKKTDFTVANGEL